MRIQIIREACCSADDQLGPLHYLVEINEGTSLKELVQKIEASGFLQFSSTHTALTGSTGSVDLVRIYSNKNAKYLVEPSTLLQPIIQNSRLTFRF